MNPMYYILIGVIVLVVAIDFYVKNKKKKSDSTDIDFPENISKPNNFLIISICSFLVFLIIGFFVADKNIYEGELTNSDDGISLIDNIIYQKLTMEDLIEQDSMWLTKNDMSPVSCIVRDKGENIGLIIDGLKEGLWQERYENGQLKYRMTYTDGLMDFEIHESWYKSGQLSQRIVKGSHPDYKPTIKFESSPEIIIFSWNFDGSLSHIMPYIIKNGNYLLHGVYLRYGEDDHIIYHLIPKGKKIENGTYNMLVKKYLSEEFVSYNDNKYSGPYKAFREDGSLIVEYIPDSTNYYQDLGDGVEGMFGQLNAFYKNGQTKSTCFFKYGLKIKNWKGWYKNGEKQFEINFGNGSEKEWKNWDENGNKLNYLLPNTEEFLNNEDIETLSIFNF